MNNLIFIPVEEKVALFAIISDELLSHENAVNSRLIDEMLLIYARERSARSWLTQKTNTRANNINNLRRVKSAVLIIMTAGTKR